MRLFKFTFIFLTQSELGSFLYLDLHAQALFQISRNAVDVLEDKQNIAIVKIKSYLNTNIASFVTLNFSHLITKIFSKKISDSVLTVTT